MVQVCNAAYGQRGWLGIASINISGSHITQSTVKVNDTYFFTAQYNTPEWRNVVMCQEVGHTLGLGHQDEIFANPDLNSCMDYSNIPGPNQHSNTHDYAQLVSIYSHLDATTTVGAAVPAVVGREVDNSEASCGTLVDGSRARGASTYVKDLGMARRPSLTSPGLAKSASLALGARLLVGRTARAGAIGVTTRRRCQAEPEIV